MLETEFFTNATNWSDCSVVSTAVRVFYPQDVQPGSAEVCLSWTDRPNEVSLEVYNIGDFTSITSQVITDGVETTVCRTVSYPQLDENSEPIGFENLNIFFNSTDEQVPFTFAKASSVTLTVGEESCTYSLSLDFTSRNNYTFQDFTTTEDVTYYIANGANLSDLVLDPDAFPTRFQTPSLSSQTPVNIILEGTLNVDIDYTFGTNMQNQRSSLTLGNNSTINVLEGRTLTIQQTDIAGCLELWNAIVIQDDATLDIRNSTVADGFRAITVEDGGKLHAEGVVFKNNHIGVYVPEDSRDGVIGSQMPNINILGSSFNFKLNRTHSTQDDFFDPKPTMLAPFIGQIPRAGAEFNDVRSGSILFASGFFGINPNSSVLQRNKFANIANGVIFNESGGTVTGSEFEFICETPGQSISGNGVAVTGTGLRSRSLAVDIFSDPNESRGDVLFRNLKTSVFVNSGATIRVFDTRMLNVENGLLSTEGNRIRFNDNEVESSQFGFSRESPALFGRSHVRGNNFLAGSLPNGASDPSAIKLVGGPENRLAYHNLVENDIELDGALFGVQIKSTNGLRVRENNVSWRQGKMFNTRGINVAHSLRPIISNNLIEGYVGDPFTNTKGIHVEMTGSPLVACNTFSDVETHLSVLYNNQGADIKGNLFLDGGVGLQYGDPAIVNDPTFTGPQIHKGNSWAGTFTGFGAAWYNGRMEDYQLSEYEVDSGDDLTFLPPSINLGVTDWFNNTLNDPTPTYVCPLTPPAPNGFAGPGEVAAKVVGGLYNPPGNWLASDWLANSRVLRSFRLGEITPSQYPGWLTWLNQPEVQTAAAFQQVEALMDNPYAITDTELTSMEALTDGLEAAHHTLALLKIRKHQNAFVDADSMRLAIEGQQTLVDQRTTDIEVLLSGIAGRASTLLATAASLNQQLQKVDLPTTYQRDMNTQAIAVWQDGLQKAQLDTKLIVEIAETCPLDGGEAVYQARALADALDLEVKIDDALNCSSAKSKNGASTPAPLAAEALIFPNPVTEQFSFDAGDKLVAAVRISDLNGRVLQSVKLDIAQSAGTVRLESTPAGVYTVSFIYNDGATRTELMIVKQ